MPKPTALEEELAIAIYDDFMSNEEWLAVFGQNKPTWEEEAEFNRDDFRAHARVAIKFLKDKGLLNV